MNYEYVSTKNRYVLSVELWIKNQNQTYIDKYLKFKKELYEFVTNNEYSKTYENYPCFHEESVKEEIKEISGIDIIRPWDRFLHIFIPKNDEGVKTMNFILNQNHLNAKMLKKAHHYDRGIRRDFRNLDEEILNKRKLNI